MSRERTRNGYRPISDYGVIGNLQTAALIARDGSLDWLCLPHFDSPSLFAALLDADKGGTFGISPSIPFSAEQSYEPFTNVLVTRFVTASGGAELVDFMPPYTEPGARKGYFHPELYRGLRGLWGEVPFRVVCDPRPDYGRVRPEVALTERGAIIRGGGMSVAVAAEVPLRRGDGGVAAEFSVLHGTARWLVLRQCAHAGCDTDLLAPGEYRAEEKYRQSLKPAYGLLSDFVPLFGRRRKSYFLLVSLLASAAGLSLALLAKPSYWQLAGLFTLMGVGLAFSDVLTDAIMVEQGRPRGLTGAFQAVQWASVSAASILVGLAGGHLAETRSLRTAFALTACFPLVALTMAFWCVKESPPPLTERPWLKPG